MARQNVPVTIDGEVIFVAAVVADDRWNGFLNPLFRRDVMEQIGDWLNAEHTSALDQGYADDLLTSRWEGDAFRILNPAYPDDDEVVTPNSDGLYPMGYGWTWMDATDLALNGDHAVDCDAPGGHEGECTSADARLMFRPDGV